jgi:hypothetical protein
MKACNAAIQNANPTTKSLESRHPLTAGAPLQPGKETTEDYKMKSYMNSLDNLRQEVKTIKTHLTLLKKIVPNNIYILEKDHIVIPRQYLVYKDTWRNKITFNIIASNEWEVPYQYRILLGQFTVVGISKFLVPVKIEKLMLYVHFKYKTTFFEKLIKTGKLPRR